jgi:hypothetical protein
MEKIKERIFPFLIALSALSVSASAAFYSVSGLSKLFAGASLEVIIMASSLEIAKLVIASLLYQYWDKLNNTLKVYLTIACTVLILITSMGIYGFLSSAYQETANKDGAVTQQVTALETKKDLYEQNRDNILKEKQSLAELKGTLSKGSTTQYTDKKGNLVVRSNNATIRNIEAANKSDEKLTAKLDAVNDSIFSLENKILEVKTNGDAASELGPLKYLSELTGVEMNRIINWLLLVIIFVFDPLAIALVIAANFAFSQLRKSPKPYKLNEEDKEWLDADLANDPDFKWDDYGNPEFTTNENNIYDENPNAPINLDLNKDGVVDENEIKQVFDQADTNNDGFIDTNEAKTANLDVKTTEKLNRLNQALESIENLNNNNSYDFQWKKELMDRELGVIRQALVDTISKKDDDTITYF